VHKPSDQTWTEDEQALLQTVAQQLAQKAENLRLFEDTQQRATREQIARRIIDKVRASRSIETALKTATEELNKALGTARAVIDLQIETQPQSEPVAAQREETAGVNAAAVITPTNGRPAEAPVNFGLNLG
jgi:GAF domain-containing protein